MSWDSVLKIGRIQDSLVSSESLNCRGGKGGTCESPLIQAPLIKPGLVVYGCVLPGFSVSSDGAFTATLGNFYEYSAIPTVNSFFLCAVLTCFLVTYHSAGREKGDIHSLPPALNV